MRVIIPLTLVVIAVVLTKSIYADSGGLSAALFVVGLFVMFIGLPMVIGYCRLGRGKRAVERARAMSDTERDAHAGQNQWIAIVLFLGCTALFAWRPLMEQVGAAVGIDRAKETAAAPVGLSAFIHEGIRSFHPEWTAEERAVFDVAFEEADKKRRAAYRLRRQSADSRAIERAWNALEAAGEDNANEADALRSLGIAPFGELTEMALLARVIVERMATGGQ